MSPSIADAPDAIPAQATDNDPAPRAKRSPRRRAREFAVQGLYQWRVGGNDEAAILAHLQDMEGFARADRTFCFALISGVIADSAGLEGVLAPCIDRPLHELSPVEAVILLIGSLELAQHPETPCRVIINECVELTKLFGGTDGYKYVNGVLDKIATHYRPEWASQQRQKSARQAE